MSSLFCKLRDSRPQEVKHRASYSERLGSWFGALPWVEVSLFSREKEEMGVAIFDRTKISSFQRKLIVGSA